MASRSKEALSGDMLRERPDVCRKYIHQIERACRGATWNRAHEVLAMMERRYERTCVLTQNVDGFHRRAGSQNVIEIHGDVHRLSCTRCQFRDHVEDHAGLSIPPRCPDCGAIVRPEVIVFGEMLARATLYRYPRRYRPTSTVRTRVDTTTDQSLIGCHTLPRNTDDFLHG
jgi:NAD-dependent deacetylase